MISKSEIVVVSDRATLARAAAERFVTFARQFIETHGRFCVALSGGSTPREMYAVLATPEFATQVDWSRVHFFWGDERAVPPDHTDSNFKMANDTLLARVPVPPQNAHRIHGELPPENAAREYARELREFFQPQSTPGTQTLRETNHFSTPSVSPGVNDPSFDLILLGLGSNGHTASLFPHTRVLRETQRWVVAEYIAEVKTDRITLTVPVINAAKNILWLVAGADKAQTLDAVLRGDYRPDDLPAQLIQPTNGTMTWLIDKEANQKPGN